MKNVVGKLKKKCAGILIAGVLAGMAAVSMPAAIVRAEENRQTDYQAYVEGLKQKSIYAMQTGDVSIFEPSDEVLAKYYKNRVSKEQAAYAEAQCALWALQALSGNYATDLERVKAVGVIVANRSKGITYGQDANGFYQTPYGVVRACVYTCAGTTRTIGRVLDYMGYKWQHVNEGQNSHQWVLVENMDGQQGFVDSMTGLAGYGEMQSGMQVDGWTLIY